MYCMQSYSFFKIWEAWFLGIFPLFDLVIFLTGHHYVLVHFPSECSSDTFIFITPKLRWWFGVYLRGEKKWDSGSNLGIRTKKVGRNFDNPSQKTGRIPKSGNCKNSQILWKKVVISQFSCYLWYNLFCFLFSCNWKAHCFIPDDWSIQHEFFNVHNYFCTESEIFIICVFLKIMT